MRRMALATPYSRHMTDEEYAKFLAEEESNRRDPELDASETDAGEEARRAKVLQRHGLWPDPRDGPTSCLHALRYSRICSSVHWLFIALNQSCSF